MNVLITGAAGDIGSRLVAFFTDKEDVALFTTDLTKPLVEGDYTHQNFDVRDPKFFEWVKEVGPQVVVHLASIIQLPANMLRSDAYDIDVLATKNLMEACLDVGVKKVVLTSSGAAYGYWKDNADWLTEDMPIRGNEDYFYSSHKRQVEELMAHYRKHHSELKQVVLRPGTVLGPNFKNPITNMFAQKSITGIRGCDSPFVIIWVDDLVAYLIEAVMGEIEGVYNVAGDGTMSLQKIAQRLNKTYIAWPSWLLRGLLSVLKPLKLSQYGAEQVKFIEFRPVLDNDKIKRDFKHQPSKTTRQAFESFLEETNKDYVA